MPPAGSPLGRVRRRPRPFQALHLPHSPRNPLPTALLYPSPQRGSLCPCRQYPFKFGGWRCSCPSHSLRREPRAGEEAQSFPCVSPLCSPQLHHHRHRAPGTPALRHRQGHPAPLRSPRNRNRPCLPELGCRLGEAQGPSPCLWIPLAAGPLFNTLSVLLSAPCPGESEKRRRTKGKAPTSSLPTSSQTAKQREFPLAAEKLPYSPGRWCLPYYLLQPLSVSVSGEKACLPPASPNPIWSVFLKTPGPGSFPKLGRQQSPETAAEGPNAAPGVPWQGCRVRPELALLLRLPISLGTFYSEVNY